MGLNFFILLCCTLLIEGLHTFLVKGKSQTLFPSISSNNSTNRVVFGQDIPSGQYVPYQVSLQYFTKNGEYKHFCGGSVIAPNRILTAGHCCEGLNPKRMSIVAGIRNLNDTNGIRSQVKKCTMHESYMKIEFNDIAILDIESALSFSDRIQSIDVSDADTVEGNMPVTLTGWGLRLPVEVPFLPPNYEVLNFPQTLQKLDYFTLSNSECHERGMSDVSEKEICAMRKTFVPRGACIGDSGGPLVMKTETGVKQVGVVSYGFRVCGVMPDVYTRVSMYTDWIKNKLI